MKALMRNKINNKNLKSFFHLGQYFRHYQHKKMIEILNNIIIPTQNNVPLKTHYLLRLISVVL